MVREDALEEFLWFMCERQRIWHRKEVEGEDPPWTSDPVLNNYHFCNVHRELDRGTKFLIENILPHEHADDVIFNVVLYRLLNKPDSYKAIGGFTPADEFDVDEAVHKLELWGEENTIFSPAYIIPAHRFAGSDSKVHNIFYGVIQDDLYRFLPEYTKHIIQAESLEAAHRVLTNLRGVGDFIAYEIVTDLNYELLDFSENDFVNVGPGAEKGIDVIWPGTEDYVDKIRYIVRYQDALFQEYDMDFPYWEEKPELTCRDVEHSFCEFFKEWRVRHQGGHTRKYDPHKKAQRDMDEFL